MNCRRLRTKSCPSSSSTSSSSIISFVNQWLVRVPTHSFSHLIFWIQSRTPSATASTPTNQSIVFQFEQSVIRHHEPTQLSPAAHSPPDQWRNRPPPHKKGAGHSLHHLRSLRKRPVGLARTTFGKGHWMRKDGIFSALYHVCLERYLATVAHDRRDCPMHGILE